MARLSISSLGTLEISLGDRPLTGFSCDKAKALLLYLVMEADRTHRRGHIVGLLWPDYPERDARHTLSQVLYNVRHVIGDRGAGPTGPQSPFLDVTRDTLQFQRTSDYWLDADVVAAHRTPQDLGHVSRSLETLERAIALYRGPFLEGFSLGDCPAFEEWALLQRERLERAATALLVTLVRAYSEQHAYDRALHYVRRQLALDPWREDAHRELMRLLALSGRRTEALAQYEACCQVLRSELHITPDAETVALAGQIRGGALAPPRQLPRAARGTRPAPLHTLPASYTPFVGRHAELALLDELLDRTDCRLLTLTGPGGIGKSRLALEAARQQVARTPNRFPDGAFLVTLTSLESAEGLVPAIAQATGLSFSATAGPQAAQLGTYLRGRNVLLLLDGAEHLLRSQGEDASGTRSVDQDNGGSAGVAGIIGGLLAAAPELKLLVTSRVRLNMLGEQLCPVGELSYPEAGVDTVAALAEFEAVQLFVRSAQQVQPAFELHADNCGAVACICRYVQGHPLALLLAATWVSTETPFDIAAALTAQADPDQPNTSTGQGLDVLQAEWQNVPARHRSLRAVVEHSWRLLAPRGQRMFRALSTFRGSFTLAMAEAVAGATVRDLHALQVASLLSRTGQGRYVFHALLRQFAAEKLDADPEVAERTRSNYGESYVAALEGWAEASKGPRQQQVLEEMDLEIDNARAAWDWIVARGDVPAIERGLQGLGLYYERRARLVEGEAVCQSAVTRLEVLAALGGEQQGEIMRVLSKTLRWHSAFLPLARAVPVARRSLALLDELAPDVRRERAAALMQLGSLQMPTDRDEAGRLLEGSLALWEEVGTDWDRTLVLCELGWRGWHISDFEAARGYFDASLVLARPLGDTRTIVRATMGLSGVDMAHGRFQEAERLSEECLALCRTLGDPLLIADALYSLAMKHVTRGRFKDAIVLLDDTMGIYHESAGAPHPLAHAVSGWARMFLGKYAEARIQTEIALGIMERAQSQRGLAWTRYVLGGIALAEGSMEEAEVLLRASVERYRQLQQWMELTFAISVLGYTLYAKEQLQEARDSFLEALRIGQTIGSHCSLGWGLSGMALLVAREGDAERAVELYAAACACCPIMAHARWFLEMLERPIAAAAVHLTGEVVAAAQARGQALDLDGTVATLLEPSASRAAG